MNHRPQYLSVSQAIEGFILHKNAQGLSQRTVSSYKDILEHSAVRIGGKTRVPKITSEYLKRYIVWKTTEYVPVRKNGKTHPLSSKTSRNWNVEPQGSRIHVIACVLLYAVFNSIFIPSYIN